MEQDWTWLPCPDAPDWPWWNYSISLNDLDYWMYVEVPKAACSVIKATLANIRHMQLGESARFLAQPEIHVPPNRSPHLKPFQTSPQMLTEAIHGTNWLRFTAVRDPYRRARSAFVDKILQSDTPRSTAFFESIESTRHDHDVETLFLLFLDYVKKTSDEDRDPHWRSQVALTRAKDVSYDLVFNAERLDHEWSLARHAFHTWLPLQAIDSTHTTRARQGALAYSTVGLEIVKEVYREDYETFDEVLTGRKANQD